MAIIIVTLLFFEDFWDTKTKSFILEMLTIKLSKSKISVLSHENRL